MMNLSLFGEFIQCAERLSFAEPNLLGNPFCFDAGEFYILIIFFLDLLFDVKKRRPDFEFVGFIVAPIGSQNIPVEQYKAHANNEKHYPEGKFVSDRQI